MIAVLLVLLPSAAALAQGDANPRVPSSQPLRAWSAEIVISGGFTGRGRGTIRIDSAGRAACTLPMRCPDVAPASMLDAIGTRIAGVAGLRWTRPSPTAVCSDCFTTTFTIRTPAADGSEAVNVFSWSDADYNAVPEDIKQAYLTVAGLASPQSAPANR